MFNIQQWFSRSEPALPAFPAHENPAVSIIIITYNKWHYTKKCLASIPHAIKDIPYEIILIDNASTDQTRDEVSTINHIHTVLNSDNLGYIKGCNQAAALAKGAYLYFLNNDTVLHEGAIQALYERITSDTGIGAVGSKILLPQGKLQEAGSMLWNDGSAYGYGRGDDPSLPEYAFARPVDFCSAASLMVRTDHFRTSGCFDTIYEPAYYEEVDYCLRCWSEGVSVIYEPRSVLDHYEYGSSSSEQAVAQMQKNQQIIARRWASALESKPSRNDELATVRNRDRRTGQRIAILTSTSNGSAMIASELPDTLPLQSPITVFAAEIPDRVQAQLQHQMIEVQPRDSFDKEMIWNNRFSTIFEEDASDNSIPLFQSISVTSGLPLSDLFRSVL